MVASIILMYQHYTLNKHVSQSYNEIRRKKFSERDYEDRYYDHIETF